MCRCTHRDTHTKEQAQTSSVCLCSNLRRAARLNTDRGWLIHQRLREAGTPEAPCKTTTLERTFTYKCLRWFSSPSFVTAFISISWKEKLKAEVNTDFPVVICWLSCLFSYAIPCPYKIICFVPFLSHSASKFMVGCSFLEKGQQAKDD